MKYFKSIIIITIFMVCSLLYAQADQIFFGQQKAIKNLSKDSGMSESDLEAYIIQRYGQPLNKLSQAQGASLITDFQSGAISKASIMSRSVVGKESQLSKAEKKALLTAASVLEEGMKKRFHFKDGSISEGEIINVDNEVVTLSTESGEFKIPKTEFLAETAEITNKKGEKFVGNVLSEDEEEFKIRTQYGDATIHKKNIEKMSRFHGGILDKKTEARKKFYTGEAVLLSVFLDPTATPLSPNTFYISGMSLGYGLTDRFMLTTKYASNFNGDLNLHPKMRFYHKKSADSEKSMAFGLGFHRSYPIKSIIGKYSHAIKLPGERTLNDSELELEDVMKPDSLLPDNPMYAEAYLVFSSSRINPSGRGKVGWNLGAKVTNAFSNRDKYIKEEYSWDKSFKVPFRLWASLDYDLRKDLKFVASMWADNGYKTLNAGTAFEDYIGSDGSQVLSIDSIRGKESLVDFDFGILYAVNQNFRIGVHFQQPFLDIYWEFFEF
ncbi:hypothetical protein OAD01_03050 [Candidatus Marinimicrobia bacterium]|jgi:hypothetical protein|nr:hypothetical protein [Candidatus Neomarinimicrobiota bacterium]